MKKNFYLLLFVAIGLASCGKDFHSDDTPTNTVTVYTTPQQAAADDAAIKSYFTANNITTAKKDTSGLYYQILSPGAGKAITSPTAMVTVTYTGTLLDGTVFDSEPSALNLKLSTLIIGWQVGLPYINSGGSIILYIPSGLAYGVTSPSSLVPANAVLIYNINLISVQ